jgi:hypothetical protein
VTLAVKLPPLARDNGHVGAEYTKDPLEDITLAIVTRLPVLVIVTAIGALGVPTTVAAKFRALGLGEMPA